jgi:hypothetical protein
MSPVEKKIRGALAAIEAARLEAKSANVRVLCDQAARKLHLALGDMIERGDVADKGEAP